VILETRLPKDDERTRLFAVYEASRVKEHATASQLLYPSRRLPHETYMKLIDDLRAIRTDCNDKMLAVRAHHDQMEEKQRLGHQSIQIQDRKVVFRKCAI
jgi:hypothetical protein